MPAWRQRHGGSGMAAAAYAAGSTKRRDDVQITLVDPRERFTERLRLHLTATGRQLTSFDIPELLADTGVEFVRGWVTALDADARTVHLDD
ncbi:hypothetical protein ACLMAL_18160 [Nocardia sp. CWNU-33]|uniref:hypothetical protein n=1 Tax=Nocardia sp. CWNU-33 TaxID=3392117 RepID=UPI00398F0BA6